MLSGMRLDKLPRWLVSDEESVWQETAHSRRMTPEERLVVLAAVCRSSAKLLAMNERRDYVLTHPDPIPQSSLDALARLRAQARFNSR